MKSSTSKLLLGLAAGGGAMWAFGRWRRKKERSRAEEERHVHWGAEHDEDPVASRLEPEGASPPNNERGLTREFDRIFMAHGLGIPVPYLRALADRESGLNPDDPKGLINVVRVVLDDFNAAHRTDLGTADLKDPRTNVTIAAWALRKIIDSYAKWHPDVPNLREDWSNKHFVELLTYGWNAGWSKTAGVGRVVDYLKQRGQYDIALADVVKHADAAGASHWLWAHPKKPKWTASVARIYFAELERDVAAGRAPMPPDRELPARVAPPPPTRPSPPAVVDPYPTPVAFDFGRPVPPDVKAIVSSGWSSWRAYRGGLHHSIDIPLAVGTSILAIDDGVVAHVDRSPDGAAGIYVAVRHPSGVVSRYLHLSEVLVENGQSVQRGGVIGKSGDTGRSEGPHLHLDLHVPEAMLPQIEAAVGRPTTGHGKARAGLGVAIPAEPWVPVDGYAPDVIRKAAETRIPLWRTRHAGQAPEAPAAAPDEVIWV